ncbi:BnaA08g24850D [Brassica napus]|uniref:BnaA08g24850D protein n=1 Tax=Brassica napus TaxID=3708 RepID=A0A078G3K8_BRANA|nr:BnaA08g24850D [Brassica napus]
MSGNDAVKTAKIVVWWDMKDCPIPEGYDARQVRPSIERACKKIGYSGPVSITAYADQTQTPAHHLQALSSTGVAVAHTISECTCKLMYEDIVEWRDHNPPPATMMIISDHVEVQTYKDLFLLRNAAWLWKKLLEEGGGAPLVAGGLSSAINAHIGCGLGQWDVYIPSLISRHLQKSNYKCFLAYSFRPCKMTVMLTSAAWLWESLLSGSTHPLPLSLCVLIDCSIV